MMEQKSQPGNHWAKQPLDTLLDVAESIFVKFSKLLEFVDFFPDFDFVECFVPTS